MVKRVYVKTWVVVVGSGRFPTELLEEDTALPEGANDWRKVLCSPGLPEEDRPRREVHLVRFSRDGGPLRADRWAARGWNVVSDESAVANQTRSV
jgi:hypothetical protein